MRPAPVGCPYAKRFLSSTTPIFPKSTMNVRRSWIQDWETVDGSITAFAWLGVSHISIRQLTKLLAQCGKAGSAFLRNPTNQRTANVSNPKSTCLSLLVLASSRNSRLSRHCRLIEKQMQVPFTPELTSLTALVVPKRRLCSCSTSPQM